MYFPFLRGKQFELIALRNYSQKFPGDDVLIPIIEPVKMSLNSLKTAITTMFGNQLRFALILDSNEGDFLFVKKDLIKELPILEENMGKWIPAFETIQGINPDFGDKMLILRDGTQSAQIRQLVNDDSIRYFVAPVEVFDRRNRRELRDSNKALIRLDDSFKAKKKNLDYVGVDEEKFSEEHLYYEEEHFFGFSDFAQLPSVFVEGGTLPAVVVIHLTYDKGDDGVYMRHFTSECATGTENIQKKFGQAAKKVKDFYESHPEYPMTEAVVEIINLYENQRFPGLGGIKKLSLSNHLELMHNILLAR